jgi:outer membrane protein assembly factor BamB
MGALTVCRMNGILTANAALWKSLTSPLTLPSPREGRGQGLVMAVRSKLSHGHGVIQPLPLRGEGRVRGEVRFTPTYATVQRFLAAFCLVPCLAYNITLASDWPQFLGPTRNGVYPTKDLAQSWPKGGPPIIWQKGIGQGFSGPAVAQGRVILFHRVDNQEVIESFDSKTGGSLWKFAYPTAYRDDFGFDEGPRATPAISDDKVYTHGAEGVLSCVEFSSGKKLWSVDTRAQFHSAKGFFGIACSPLIAGQAVLLNIGGRDGAGIVAFDRLTGKVLWKATDDEAGYSSPVVGNFQGRQLALFLTKANLVGAEPANGKIAFTFPFRPNIRASVTAATPLVIDDLIFISGNYGAGAALLRVTGSGIEKLWAGDDILSNHYATSVYHGGFLYGIHGRTDPGWEPAPSLRCVELKTGKVKWQKENFGAAVLTLAGSDLLILTERGELILAPASAEAYKPSLQAQTFPNGMRAHPALADDFLYARGKDKLFCVDLRPIPK